MAIVRLDPNFAGQLETLKAEATLSAESTLGQGQRVWYIPTLDGWSGNPFDISNMGLAFYRNDINADYIDALNRGQSGGKIADLIAANVQVSYLSMQERALRSRHTSPIRARMHAAARQRGHGSDNGVFDMVAQHVINVIDSGTE